jgi:hypothetical protein
MGKTNELEAYIDDLVRYVLPCSLASRLKETMMRWEDSERIRRYGESFVKSVIAGIKAKQKQ